MVELMFALALGLSLFAQEPPIQLTPVISGLNAPVDIQNAKDASNRLFIVEQSGVIRIAKNGVLNGAAFLDIRTRVKSGGEQGLLGLAFPPGFTTNRRFYVNYINLSGDTVIAMYSLTADNDIANPGSETILLTIDQPFDNHNGGQLRFGPDGFLYIGMGDGGGSGDPQGRAQNRQSLLGKMLRIDVESEPGSVRIPLTNPFAGSATTRPEIWALGFRNPWRFSFDRTTGDMWIGDVGQNSWEEISFQPASSSGGENYGWNTMEGAHCYQSANCNQQGLVLPVAEYVNGADCSVTGGFVYRGPASPSLQGTYFYGDFCSGKIWSVRRNGAQFINQLRLDSNLRITTFGEDEAGEVYLADGLTGTIHRLEATATNTGLTISSIPAGQRFMLDADPTPLTAPQTLSLTPGSTHTITWLNTETASARTIFSAWSDGNTANPRTVTIGQTPAALTGEFVSQVLLTRNFSAGGTVTVTPSNDGWYTVGSSIQAVAAPNAGFRFDGFSGCTSSTSSSVSFFINTPCALNAQFTMEQIAASGLRFVVVAPCRVADTRDAGRTGSFGPPRLSAGVRRDMAITQSACAIPASARAYSLNVTVVPAGSLGFLTIWPKGVAQPLVSTLNSSNSRVVANAAIVPAGEGGDISLFATDATEVIVDINGYFTDTAPDGLAFFTTAPCRPVDTRGESGQTGAFGPPILNNGVPRDFPLAQGPCALPASAAAYSLNATVVPETPLAYLTLWPSALPQPLVSTLNSFDGSVASNAAIVAVGSTRSVSAFASGRTHLILDSNGYFAAPSANGMLFYPVSPCRVADTRPSGGKSGGFGPPAMNGGSQREFPIPQSGCGIPAAARAYALNITVVPHAPLDYLTLWPADQPRPFVSTLNSFEGRTVANAALALAGANGAVSLYVTHTTDVVIDITGYFAP
jgi:glucose/arabinose dehydrogenase